MFRVSEVSILPLLPYNVYGVSEDGHDIAKMFFYQHPFQTVHLCIYSCITNVHVKFSSFSSSNNNDDFDYYYLGT